MARMFAAFFGVGGTLALWTLVLPAPPDRRAVGVAVAGLLAWGVSAAMLLAPERLPIRAYRLILAAGTVLTTVVIYCGGAALASAYGMFYVLVVLAAFYFFPRSWALFHLAFVGLAFASVMVLIPHGRFGELRWSMLMGTLAVAGALLLLMQEQIRRLVDQLQQLARQLDDMARTDELTGLPNRRAFNEALTREMARGKRIGRGVCILMLDLDNFKNYNDEHGHPGGDLLLKEAAASWTACTRAGDLLVRYGGEEFAVLVPDSEPGEAMVMLARLRACTPGGQTCSAGVACWDLEESAQALLARADRALYQAKDAGRDRVVTS